ncbi:MAG: hypothetical protein WCG25_03910 [bacterium]
MSNRSSNSFFPIMIMLWSFWTIWMVLFVFDDDDKKSTYSQDAIKMSVDTNYTSADIAIKKDSTIRGVIFEVEDSGLITYQKSYSSKNTPNIKVHKKRYAICNVDYLQNPVVIAYIQNNYIPLNSAISQIYKDRLAKN